MEEIDEGAVLDDPSERTTLQGCCEARRTEELLEAIAAWLRLDRCGEPVGFGGHPVQQRDIHAVGDHRVRQPAQRGRSIDPCG
ncbi:MAG: hypothetical protein LPK27_17145 [Rhodococcus sp. (in: high G+C Gram-positive bacteria)]|nr:hypothetical protein [Rhodococcus sp. (in: high G+C Gram-positive bacteria)]